MTLEQAMKQYGRDIRYFMEIDAKVCTLDFGVGACTATGEPCYICYSTCKDKPNFNEGTRTDRICQVRTDPFPDETIRDYIKMVSFNPTEIGDSINTTARVTVTLADVPDNDVGVDKSVSMRSYDPEDRGSFWRRYFKRHRDAKGYEIRLYAGAEGLARSEYQMIFPGNLDAYSFPGDGECQVVIVDFLAALKDIKVPPESSLETAAAITAAATDITLTGTVGLYAAPGYVTLANKEYVYYTSIDTGSNQIKGCTRGANGTDAVAHSAGAKVQPVLHFPESNQYDRAKSILLTEAGYPSSYVDSTGIDAERDWPGGEINCERFVPKPTPLSDLFYSLVRGMDNKAWMNESRKITLKRTLPNDPDRDYVYIREEGDILRDTEKFDPNPDSRYNKVTLYWDLMPFGDPAKKEGYNRTRSQTDDESVAEYGDERELVVLLPWIKTGYLQEELILDYLDELIGHWLLRFRDPQPIITLKVDPKDYDVLTGWFVRVTTDAVIDETGATIPDCPFQCISRRVLSDREIELKLLMVPEQKWGFIAPDTAPDFDAATLADKEYCYITEDDGTIDHKPGYYIY